MHHSKTFAPGSRGISADARATRRSIAPCRQLRRRLGHDLISRRRNAFDQMKTALSSLDLRRAHSIDDALEIMRAEHRVPIAGATDVYVGLNFGTLRAPRFLDLWAIDELRTISVVDDRLVLGALVTYSAMIASSEVH